NDAFDFTVETSGATRLTFGAAGVITAATSLNMNNNVVENIGAAGTDFLAGGGLTLAGALTVSAGGAAVTGNSSVNITLAGTTDIGTGTNTGTVTIGNTTNQVALASDDIVAANLPAGANTDALVTITAGGQLRETSVATMIGNTAWLVGGNTTLVQATATQIFGLPASGTADAIAFQTNGATRLTIGAASGITAATTLDMNNNVINNIGVAGTDFTGTGGLTLADALTVSAGGAAVTGNSSINNTLAGTTDIGTGTNTGTVTIGNTTNQVALASDDIVAANLPAGANTDALVTITAGGQVRETSVATMLGNTAWLLGGNTTLVQATATQIFGLPASGTADAIAFQTNGATRLTIGAASGITAATTLDMNNNVINNVGVAGTDFTGTGGLTLADALTVSAGGAAVTGTTTINNTAAANTTTIGDAFAGNTLTVNSATVNMANLPAGASTDALITTDGTALRETSFATMLANNAWLVGGNTTLVQATATRIFGLPASGTADAIAFQTNGATRLTIGAASGITAATTLDMNNNVINNIGVAGTDFSGTGGLTLADALTVSPVTNQIILGTTNTTTLNAAAPAASAVYTIPDVGVAASFVMTAGDQTIAGNKTFSGTTQLDGDLQGAGANKFADRVLITGNTVATTFTIANTLVTATSVIILNLEDGNNNGDFTVKVSARNPGNDFTITLSGAALPNGDTKWVNYIIVNP
ncbi:MAG TPA: hypothetical protein VK147_06905, partial [Candidatus Didemnitutus sp.]|nr:hypothetical protein [Candidatus Didemnitutus sp.]